MISHRSGGRFTAITVGVILCVASLDLVIGGRDPRYASYRRNKRSPQMDLSSLSLTDLIQAISGNNGGNIHSDLSRFAPTTPQPEEVNCYVDVATTILRGGQCINLGDASPPNMVCQAGIHVAFTPDCQNITPSDPNLQVQVQQRHGMFLPNLSRRRGSYFPRLSRRGRRTRRDD